MMPDQSTLKAYGDSGRWFCATLEAFIFTFQYLEWIRGDIYDVFSPKDSKSGLKNIKILWDHGPTWP